MARGRPRNEEIRQRIVNLYNKKPRPSLEEIGRVTGVTRQRVSQVLRELSIEAQETASSDVAGTVEEIYKLSGMNKNDLAIILDVSRNQIANWSRQPASANSARRLAYLLKALRHATSLNSLYNKDKLHG
jgi:transcriptional regulator with XRE-family HTH domain